MFNRNKFYQKLDMYKAYTDNIDRVVGGDGGVSHTLKLRAFFFSGS